MIQQTIDSNEMDYPKEHFELIDTEHNKRAFLKKEITQKENIAQQTTDNSELDSLKELFGLLNAKLEKQRILSEEIINDAMQEKLSHIEKWYHNRFLISFVSAPIVSAVFLFMYIGQGAEYWTFGLYILAVAALEYFLNRRSYRILNVKILPSLSMTQATENIARHKQMRSQTNRIMAIPIIILIAWTILIASDFVWRPFVTILTITSMAVSIIWGIQQERANRKRLEEILRMIKNLRG